MFSFLLLCYYNLVMKTNGDHILVIGSSSPLVEGVADLLQVAGYRVETSSSWAETEYVMVKAPPNLVIVDLSSAARDAFLLSQQLRGMPHWAEVPILFISFSGDDTIRILQILRNRRKSNGGPEHYYAHTLLSMEGLLNKVKTCLS
jgi:CheY-like chemotaxis protein